MNALCTYQWFSPGWGAGQPTGIRLRKAHVGGDFDIHNGPQGGKFDSTAILKSGEDLGMSEWSAILENTQKQEPITRSVQLPYCAYATAFSQAVLFLLCAYSIPAAVRRFHNFPSRKISPILPAATFVPFWSSSFVARPLSQRIRYGTKLAAIFFFTLIDADVIGNSYFSREKLI